MLKKYLLPLAIELRKSGYSLNEVSNKLKISKSTASLWLLKQKISSHGRKRLDNLIIRGREKSRAVLREKRKNRINQIARNCSVLRSKVKFNKDALKLMLALLYWCEGAKTDRRIIFMNSDHDLIKSFLMLLRRSFSIDESRLKAVLHLHEYHNKEIMLKYWSKVTDIKQNRISIYNKKNSGSRKRDNYKGCISIRYGDSEILDEILLIIKRFSTIAGVV